MNECMCDQRNHDIPGGFHEGKLNFPRVVSTVAAANSKDLLS